MIKIFPFILMNLNKIFFDNWDQLGYNGLRLFLGLMVLGSKCLFFKSFLKNLDFKRMGALYERKRNTP